MTDEEILKFLDTQYIKDLKKHHHISDKKIIELGITDFKAHEAMIRKRYEKIAADDAVKTILNKSV